MSQSVEVLICDDDSLFQLAVKQALKGRYVCRSAYNGDEALAIVKSHQVGVLLLDVSMRSPDEGLRYLPRLLEADADLAVIMSSGTTEFSTVREAMRLGALDYVPKDFDPNDLAHIIERVLDRQHLKQRQEQSNFELAATQRQHVMVGESAPIKKLHRTIEKMRSSPANVVITGETGTGKEVVARQLRGTLPDGSMMPFIAVDSSTIQSTTAESQLFGHEKGAFTGADKCVRGVFEEANGGIVYFDEIANMPLEIQAKLLRILQEKEVVRLGSSRPIKLEFRVICATNRNLDEMVRAGQFKDDLLQRLNVLPIFLPPLRERRDDIPALVAHFCRIHGKERPVRFTDDALFLLESYDWPGNIRELGNLIAYVLTMAESNEIDITDLPPKIRDLARRPSHSDAPHAASNEGFYERVAEFEKQILANEYSKSDGNVSKLAIRLGMDRSHLHTKLKEHGIHGTKNPAKKCSSS